MTAGGYDVIVIGAGHAGCEAALAAARLGASVLLLSGNLDRVGHMACNCSIGGPAKGHMVAEIDALGGEMGRAIDETFTHIRMLNTGKGPAVQALRAQADKRAYEQRQKEAVEHQPGLHVLQSEAAEVLAHNGIAVGVATTVGEEFRARAVVVCAGTFLRARVYYGHTVHELGRAGERASVRLGETLASLGLRVVRLKTGTVPRVAYSTVDRSSMARQESDPAVGSFSWTGTDAGGRVQHPCFVTRLGSAGIEFVRANLGRSAMYGGLVTGPGPRYCPSIEAKVVRFPDKTGHPVFLEREGATTEEVYVQGLSTSLPPDAQRALLGFVPGLEQARVLRYGYAVEYDAYDPRMLLATLESDVLGGLFLAGQVNGTSGYEEAAAQGLIAGVNAVALAGGGRELRLERASSYIGVMLADLTEKGVDEPYRMMTARAANRLELRASSAPERLTPVGRELGLVGADQWAAYERRSADIALACEWTAETRSDRAVTQRWPTDRWGPPPPHGRSVGSLLEHPTVEFAELLAVAQAPDAVLHALSDTGVAREVEARCRYRGYIARERSRSRYRSPLSLSGVDFGEIGGLKQEALERLQRACPTTTGEAARLRGVTAADVDALEVWAARQRRTPGDAGVSRET